MVYFNKFVRSGLADTNRLLTSIRDHGGNFLEGRTFEDFGEEQKRVVQVALGLASQAACLTNCLPCCASLMLQITYFACTV